jgi:hypothetical protein
LLAYAEFTGIRVKQGDHMVYIYNEELYAVQEELLQALTTATTILALIPVLTSTGRGSDIMVPMAIPSFGGMLIEIMTMLVVPVLYCSVQEWKLRLGIENPRFAQHEHES